MNKIRSELTVLMHVLFLLSGIMLITILVSSYSYGTCAKQHDYNSIITSRHRERFFSIEDLANNTISELNSSGVIKIGHNAPNGVHLVGKVKLSSLPSTMPTASEGHHVRVIPFHPKNLTSFLAEKRHADLNLTRPDVKVFGSPSSNHSSVNLTKWFRNGW